jgi:integrase/recombinase XerD
MTPTVKLLLDTRYPKKNGLFPVKIRITYNRKQKYYSLGKDLSKDDFNDATSSTKKLPKELKDISKKFKQREGQALDIIDELKSFDLKRFDERFNGFTSSKTDVKSIYDKYIRELEKNDQIRTADSYRYSFKSISSYSKNNLDFDDVSAEFLNGYEKWMMKNNKSITTIGMYLRCLRTIINIAIEKQIIPRESYPFGKRKYVIPASNNIKKALPMNVIGLIASYDSGSSLAESNARDYWIFSYLSYGLNFKDIAKLKYKNIDGNTIKIIRSKTVNSTKNNQKHISIPLLTKSLQIIERLGNSDQSRENYVFPILKPKLSVNDQEKLIKQFIKTTNKYMIRIGKKLGISTRVTTYVARHSFATIMKFMDAPTSFIQEQLGHTSITTTENYLASFDIDTKRAYSEKLLSFKKSNNE